MSFKEDFSRLVEQITQRREVCRNNEEATKQALILPFLQILGYDIWNPLELVPEYKAGWANAEKVDYAIFINEKPAVFIEAKAYGGKLINYDAQLAKYFNSTPDVKIAIITDGVTYKFFTDAQQLNIMDKEPLFEFQIDDLKPQDFEVLNKLRKESFDVDSVILEAENLVYLKGFMKKLRQFFNNPSDDFIKFLASDIYPSRLTSKAIERLQPLVKQAVSTTLVSMVSKGLSQGISDEEAEEPENSATQIEQSEKSLIETTEQELKVYEEIVKIVASVYPEHEINYKDTQSYFGIQIQKPSKWFCRLHFNNQKRIYVAFKLPEDVAKQHVPEELVQSYSGECCSVTYETLDDIKMMEPLILESYKAQR